MNMTRRIAARRPTTAPPITAEKAQRILFCFRLYGDRTSPPPLPSPPFYTSSSSLSQRSPSAVERRVAKKRLERCEKANKSSGPTHRPPPIDSTIKRTGENSGSQERIGSSIPYIVDVCRWLGRLRFRRRGRRRPSRRRFGYWFIGLLDDILQNVAVNCVTSPHPRLPPPPSHRPLRQFVCLCTRR